MLRGIFDRRRTVLFKRLVRHRCEIIEAKRGADGVAVVVRGAGALNGWLEGVDAQVAVQCRGEDDGE